MRDLQSWLDEYAQSHQNQTNKKIHYICVPVIMFSLLGILWSISAWLLGLIVVISMIFYIKLSLKLSIYMLVITLIMIGILALLPYMLTICIVLFIISWIFQFIGHQIEGKKPSFLKDLQFLLVGPLWILSRAIDAKLN
ncbi:DUF962 domain-containing protein [Fangia hongkongensis]|uniref:Mpo1 family 2-hydroxy fatty acid dioxygenase n=1 Tax=Fangia hongkongensis TaxID=270495 RepID=UPI000375C01A|nr:Mpo1-like protein [Fangia hongkongensis]MBK2126054.1 DUF962 domain-containing protein [Fangia hongkongensis]